MHARPRAPATQRSSTPRQVQPVDRSRERSDACAVLCVMSQMWTMRQTPPTIVPKERNRTTTALASPNKRADLAQTRFNIPNAPQPRTPRDPKPNSQTFQPIPSIGNPVLDPFPAQSSPWDRIPSRQKLPNRHPNPPKISLIDPTAVPFQKRTRTSIEAQAPPRTHNAQPRNPARPHTIAGRGGGGPLLLTTHINPINPCSRHRVGLDRIELHAGASLLPSTD